ncbi:MAG: zinc ribbon domain-containing protein [Chloroflexi bacterium]|nr:zinc ribbon domain-containing protein [Chloroflexota bacterium]MCH8009584.1 zinc ribbon domain-containing protein [Chloroflexota bacterium]
MNEEGPTPLEPAACSRCDAMCAVGDNFCRQCGASLHDNAQLPSVRPNALPAIRQPSVQAVVVRGAAVVAATKIAELVARRMVRNIFRRNGRRNGRGDGKSEHLPATLNDAEIVPQEGAIVGEAVIRETFLTRTIHFRR